MDSIVLELQREALDENVNIETLLRKAYLVAKKLKLKDFEDWINQEMNGYNKEVPKYREIAGEVKAYNPLRGWIPIVFDGEMNDILSHMPLPNAISSIYNHYKSSESVILIQVNGSISDLLNETADFVTKYIFFCFDK